jgi:hypothetical protein
VKKLLKILGGGEGLSPLVPPLALSPELFDLKYYVTISSKTIGSDFLHPNPYFQQDRFDSGLLIVFMMIM